MNLEQIVYIHEYLVTYFANKDDPISPAGIKDKQLLESAVVRPFMSVNGEDAYPGIFNKASALFHSLINNHCFYNGNKRAALLSTLAYLGENGYWVTIATDDELFNFTRKTAAHEISSDRNQELSVISDFFKDNSRRREAGEHTLKFNDLKEILNGFGYELGDTAKSGTLEIVQDGKVKVKILKKGRKGKEDYDKIYINQLRKKLKLTPEYGVDSYLFYGDRRYDDTLGKYMGMRYNVMRELAKI
jgi:death-on-curing protein